MLTIDFEASCLPRHGRSYPIEVGLAGGGMVRSWLIRPHESWAGWDWTQEAEGLHGLTRARIEQDGQPVETVLAALAAATQGHSVVADSLIDQYWLDTMATAAGMPSPFRITHVATVMDEQRAGPDRVAAAVAFADAQGALRHRAGGDALWLASVLAHVAGDSRALPLLMAAQ